MRKVLTGVLVVVVIGAASWYALQDGAGNGGPRAAAETQRRYDFEAQDVAVTQTGADGRIQYRLDASRIAQASGGGNVLAEDVVIHHDPPGTTPGGANRWTVTAKAAQLPAQVQVITFAGDVRASGLPPGRKTPVILRTEQLAYDVSRQEIATSTGFSLDWGASTFTGKGFKVNFNTTDWTVESDGHGTLVP